jgi:hypothetical protein
MILAEKLQHPRAVGAVRFATGELITGCIAQIAKAVVTKFEFFPHRGVEIAS